MSGRGEPARPACLIAAILASPALAEDIRDIRGPRTAVSAWLPAALLAAALVLALCAYWLWRRRSRPRALLPHEAALQRLESIRPLMQPARAGEFSVAVSDVVRTYIGQRFEFTVTHRTTEEFLRGLAQHPDPALGSHRALLSEFLHQCDLVKFAGMSLTAQNMESLHHSAGDFVRATVPPAADAPPQHRAGLHQAGA
ncbi:MAG: DUF4381 family protein [Steroidobacteraceae bacterium]|jgi:hypothetical protein